MVSYELVSVFCRPLSPTQEPQEPGPVTSRTHTGAGVTLEAVAVASQEHPPRGRGVWGRQSRGGARTEEGRSRGPCIPLSGSRTLYQRVPAGVRGSSPRPGPPRTHHVGVCACALLAVDLVLYFVSFKAFTAMLISEVFKTGHFPPTVVTYLCTNFIEVCRTNHSPLLPGFPPRPFTESVLSKVTN